MSDSTEIAVKPKRYPPPLEERTPRVIIGPDTPIKHVKGDDGLDYTFVGDIAICGAKTHSGRYNICTVAPRKGRNRCRRHGGSTPRGMASPKWKTGTYSKDLPSRLATRYEEALSDPELLATRDDIAIITTRVSDLLKKLDTGESEKRWELLKDTYTDLIQHMRVNEWGEVAEDLKTMSNIINSANSDFEIWHEISGAIMIRKNLAESERKRLIEMKQIITTEQAMALMAFIVATVRKNISDPMVLSAITTEISNYVSENKQLKG